jgi:hypothetical protein
MASLLNCAVNRRRGMRFMDSPIKLIKYHQLARPENQTSLIPLPQGERGQDIPLPQGERESCPPTVELSDLNNAYTHYRIVPFAGNIRSQAALYQ